MIRFITLAVIAALAGCHCPPPDPPAECACDCPDGPPPAGQISTFCLDEAHAGQVCCNGSKAGECANLECVLTP